MVFTHPFRRLHTCQSAVLITIATIVLRYHYLGDALFAIPMCAFGVYMGGILVPCAFSIRRLGVFFLLFQALHFIFLVKMFYSLPTSLMQLGFWTQQSYEQALNGGGKGHDTDRIAAFV